MSASPAPALIAVDIGNSRIKLGRFDSAQPTDSLPLPATTLELPLDNREGDFDAAPLESWCRTHVPANAVLRFSTVHRRATARWLEIVRRLAEELGYNWSLQQIVNDEVPLAIEVEFPERVGTDRLMAAVAANRLRTAGRAAVVIDLGTAITIDLVTNEGVFAGGAILPGLAMGAQSLDEQTDALPRVAVEGWREPPAPLGKATEAAIASGLFWGAVGAVRELIARYSDSQAHSPDVFITGGGSQLVAEVLSRSELRVVHVPHLVLAGIALADVNR